MSSRKIGILGAESCGKTTLGKALAEHYKGTYIAEYARDYVGSLMRPYTQEDVVQIAKKQCEQLAATYPTEWAFFDTELIITKVWFIYKYGECPTFVTDRLKNHSIDYALLCDCDLPFVEDPLRENPTIRQELTDRYRQELEEYHIPYTLIRGDGERRTMNAIEALSHIG